MSELIEMVELTDDELDVVAAGQLLEVNQTNYQNNYNYAEGNIGGVVGKVELGPNSSFYF